MITSKRKYEHRHPGDIVNGAELIERVNNRLWKMRCKCGEIFISQPSTTSGRCRRCGYQVLSDQLIVHGESPRSGKNASRLYGIWLGMRVRCNDPNYHTYKYYGDRGIFVCNEWSDYLVFKEWALSNGYRDELTIDRIDVNDGYYPENCRWVTMRDQQYNKRHPTYKYGRDEFGRFRKKSIEK